MKPFYEDDGKPPTLFDISLASVQRMDVDAANRLLVKWEHKLGPCNRPFHQEAFALYVLDRPVSVAISASIVNGPVGPKDGVRYERTQVVELARQASCEPWANRVMIRLWRETCARLWPCWPVEAAVSYSHNGMHTGDLYRFDGWERWNDVAGSSGGGTWSRKRQSTETVYGPKTLWGFRYAVPTEKPQQLTWQGPAGAEWMHTVGFGNLEDVAE